jgi:hypothetical protein
MIEHKSSNEYTECMNRVSTGCNIAVHCVYKQRNTTQPEGELMYYAPWLHYSCMVVSMAATDV